MQTNAYTHGGWADGLGKQRVNSRAGEWLRRFGVGGLILALPWLVGCPPILPPPPGDTFAGSGPVASGADARLRVLKEYAGLSALQPGDTAGQVVGSGADPVYAVYEVPNGPFGSGVVVQDPFDEWAPVTLNDSYFVFWVDPVPDGDYGHETEIIYVRERDGQLTVQIVEFAPIVREMEHLYFDADKAANLIYKHAAFDALPAEEATGKALRPRPKLGAVAQETGPLFGGLAVLGAPEDRRLNDLAEANALFQTMSGDGNAELDMTRDQSDDRIDADEMAAELRKASKDLGVDDKFFFFVSSHGSKTGKVRIGEDIITYQELCRLLTLNVTAGNICCVFTMCYGGLAIDAFEGWDDLTDAGLRVVTCTDSATSRWVYADAMECAFKDVLEDLALADDPNAPTLSEIDEAFSNIDVPKAEIDQKYCDYIDGLKASDPANSAAHEARKTRYTNEGGNGAVQVGGFGPPLGPNVFDPFEDIFGNRAQIPVEGTGTTNDGGADFDLNGFLLTDDFGVTFTLSLTMQITSQQGRDPGTLVLSGDSPVSRQPGQAVYQAAGTMQVFPEGQVEDWVGSIELIVREDEPLGVLVDGTHTQGQAAVFDLREQGQ